MEPRWQQASSALIPGPNCRIAKPVLKNLTVKQLKEFKLQRLRNTKSGYKNMCRQLPRVINRDGS